MGRYLGLSEKIKSNEASSQILPSCNQKVESLFRPVCPPVLNSMVVSVFMF